MREALCTSCLSWLTIPPTGNDRVCCPLCLEEMPTKNGFINHPDYGHLQYPQMNSDTAAIASNYADIILTNGTKLIPWFKSVRNELPVSLIGQTLHFVGIIAHKVIVEKLAAQGLKYYQSRLNETVPVKWLVARAREGKFLMETLEWYDYHNTVYKLMDEFIIEFENSPIWTPADEVHLYHLFYNYFYNFSSKQGRKLRTRREQNP